MFKTNFQKGLFKILVGLAIWFMPVPEGLKPQAMKIFAIFVATIVGFILHPLPIGAIALIYQSHVNRCFPLVGSTGFSSSGYTFLCVANKRN